MDSYLKTLNRVSKAAKDVPAVKPEERRDSHQALKEGTSLLCWQMTTRTTFGQSVWVGISPVN